MSIWKDEMLKCPSCGTATGEHETYCEGSGQGFVSVEEDLHPKQELMQHIEVLIAELSDKSPTEMGAMFWKVAHEGGEEGVAAVKLVSLLSQA